MPTAVDTPIVGLYDVVTNSAFSAVSSVTVPWTAGAYRRVALYLKLATGATANIMLAFTGLSVGTYYTTGERTGGGGTWADASFSALDAFKFDLPAFAGSPLQLDVSAQLAKDGSQRMFNGTVTGYTGQGIFLTGTCLDTTHDAAGLSLTFTVACSGWLEVLGYP